MSNIKAFWNEQNEYGKFLFGCLFSLFVAYCVVGLLILIERLTN